MVMTCLQGKVQGEWSVSSEDRMETNGQADGQTEIITSTPSLMRLVKMTFSFPLTVN